MPSAHSLGKNDDQSVIYKPRVLLCITLPPISSARAAILQRPVWHLAAVHVNAGQEQSILVIAVCTATLTCPGHAPKPPALPQSLCLALRPWGPTVNPCCNPKPAICAPRCRQEPLKQGRGRDFGASPEVQGFPFPPPLLQFPSKLLGVV